MVHPARSPAPARLSRASSGQRPAPALDRDLDHPRMTETMPMHASTAPLRSLRAALSALALTVVLGASGSALAQHDTHGHDHGEQVGEQVGGPRDDGHGAGHDHGHGADAHGAGHEHGHGADAHGADHGHAANPSAHFNWVDFGYSSKDINGGTLEKGEEPMSPPILGMLINFGIVLFILGWKVWPGLQRYTAKRHDTIKTALEEAGKLREEARAKLDQYTAQTERAEREIDQMVAEIRAGAEAEKQRILADAQAQAEAMKRDAQQRITAEIDRARAELEREVVAAAIAVAERLIRENATKNDQTQLVDGFIQDIQDRQTLADTNASAQPR
jgi:F-type H+-transporting ATPase subunit b